MKGCNLDFDQVWEEHIIPLVGQTIVLAHGGKKQITAVTQEYLKRISSQGNASRIPKAKFNEVYIDLIQKEILIRASINEKYGGRRSSIIFAVLGKVPFISLKTNPVTLIIDKNKS
ncbi:hypothetical protein [Mucilaginibacter jinjuensis]|uniref:Uncharacterized protein n=1 Tax=Mucilaginibacter jinjuensis TaxID=1176721 RepID=A0ABY7T4S8_9SPHI|nr:hypothetical protein [Mucilaginibacter jinjuensis]WCT11269.1 hypothetical protein PQO05_21240 [Mucilaginibacter jinjuensis]